MAKRKATTPKASNKIKDFDPNSAPSGDGIYALPHSTADAKLVFIPVPFEATTSYLGGTSKGPDAIRRASHQVDLFHPDFPDFWRQGAAMLPTPKKILELNKTAKAAAIKSRKLPENSKERKKLVEKVNLISHQVNEWVAHTTRSLIADGKIVGLIGGDHSTPFGAIQETLKAYPRMSILHLDAHFDLRQSYEGFHYSHASIFYNVVSQLPLDRLVQFGIRDFCEAELEFAQANSQITVFTDREIFDRKARGQNWSQITNEIIESLSSEVYLSFDIDGLEPSFCPATGTPVPGGLHFNEVSYLLQKIADSGRKIVGFDLCEVGPEEWDANVGARMLFQMMVQCLRSAASERMAAIR
jgi:agmatinase